MGRRQKGTFLWTWGGEGDDCQIVLLPSVLLVRGTERLEFGIGIYGEGGTRPCFCSLPFPSSARPFPRIQCTLAFGGKQRFRDKHTHSVTIFLRVEQTFRISLFASFSRAEYPCHFRHGFSKIRFCIELRLLLAASFRTSHVTLRGNIRCHVAVRRDFLRISQAVRSAAKLFVCLPFPRHGNEEESVSVSGICFLFVAGRT